MEGTIWVLISPENGGSDLAGRGNTSEIKDPSSSWQDRINQHLFASGILLSAAGTVINSLRLSTQKQYTPYIKWFIDYTDCMSAVK